MKKKFCPKCGRETEKFYGSLCKDCFLSKVSLIKNVPDKIILRKCKICEKIYVNEKSANSIENGLDLFLMEILKQKEVHSATYRIEGNKMHITLTLNVEGAEKSEEKTSELVVKNITCKSCSLKAIEYYQSILQIRAPQNMIDEIVGDVEEQMDLMNKYNNLAFVSKIEKVVGGVDLYIGSKSVANQVAKNIKNKFKANIKISRKLSGHIRGKKAYRDTILVSVGE